MATKIITFLRNWNRFLIHGVPRTSADFQSNIVLVQYYKGSGKYINVDRMYFFTMNKIAEMKEYRTIDYSLFLINFTFMFS